MSAFTQSEASQCLYGAAAAACSSAPRTMVIRPAQAFLSSLLPEFWLGHETRNFALARNRGVAAS
jgi:hypothetical protein